MAEKKAKAEEKAEKPSLIGDDLVAVSPFPAYPGRIVFPPPKWWVYDELGKAFQKQPDEDGHDFKAMKPHLRGVLAIADIRIDGLDATDSEQVRQLDYEFVRWAVNAMSEYYRRFFRDGS